MSLHMLVVGGLRPVHKLIKRLGVRMTLFIEAKNIKAGDSKNYERVVGINPGASIEEWITLARAVHNLDPFNAVASYHEMTQAIAVDIAEGLGLPSYNRSAIEATRFKDRMRERLQAADVDLTPSARVNSVEEIEAFANQHGYPLILKPVDGWGSTGVSRIDRQEDIQGAYEWYTQSGNHTAMLVEQFHIGEELSVEAFSENGVHRIVCITQKHKESEHFVELGHCLPAPIDSATADAIHQVVLKTLTALEITQGPSHTEVMVTKNGVRIIESHTRLAGDYLPSLIESLTGVDLMELWARQTMGEQVLSQVPQLTASDDQFAAIWFTTFQAVGTIQSVEGVTEAQALPGVKEVTVLLDSGSQYNGVRDSFSRAGYASAVGSTSEEALERAQAAIKQLRFSIVCQG